MKIISKIVCFCFLMLSALTFFACTPSNLPSYTISGTVTFESVGLNDVTIKSSVKNFTETDDNGKYSFTAKFNEITIFPEKQGYIFSPAKIVLNENTDNVNFVATRIEELHGTLKLNKVIITTTSIVSSIDSNYCYSNNNKESIKAKSLSLIYKDEVYNIISEDMFLEKNIDAEILIEDEITFGCGEKQSIGFLINAYFTYNRNEYYTAYTNYSYLNITNEQTNKDLVNNTIIYSQYGINNAVRSFTFNIQFVFDYISD